MSVSTPGMFGEKWCENVQLLVLQKALTKFRLFVGLCESLKRDNPRVDLQWIGHYAQLSRWLGYLQFRYCWSLVLRNVGKPKRVPQFYSLIGVREYSSPQRRCSFSTQLISHRNTVCRSSDILRFLKWDRHFRGWIKDDSERSKFKSLEP